VLMCGGQNKWGGGGSSRSRPMPTPLSEYRFFSCPVACSSRLVDPPPVCCCFLGVVFLVGVVGTQVAATRLTSWPVFRPRKPAPLELETLSASLRRQGAGRRRSAGGENERRKHASPGCERCLSRSLNVL